MGHPRSADHHPDATDGRARWWVLVLLCLAQFMVILDVTVVNVALPVITDQLGLGRAALTWVITAYTLCFGGLMLLGGRLADTIGRRRTFLAGLIVFTAASLGAGLAPNGTVLIVARAAQGVGAALLSPAALSLVTTTFTGTERNRALGVWAAIGGAGAAIGVLLGGVFAAGPGWEWVFFINVPIGLLVVAVLPALVGPGEPARERSRPDLVGAVLATASVASLIYGLVHAGDSGWADPLTIGALALGILLGAAFVLVERRVTAPLVRLQILTRRPVIAGNLIMLGASGLLLASFFLSSQYLQRVLHVDALGTGLLFLPVALVIGLGTHLGVRVVGRFGGRPAAAIGFGLAALGLALLSRTPVDGNIWIDILPGFAVAGLGLGAVFVAATTTALAHAHPHEAGTTSGLINTGHELGATLGIAFVSTIAGASLNPAPTGMTTVDGFTTAFIAAAAVAVVLAGISSWLVPAGPPPATDRPVFAH